MKKGNCLLFAISDFLRNGGELYIEFWRKFTNLKHIHFTVQRNGLVFDYVESNRSGRKQLWFIGEKRIFQAETYKRLSSCKRICLFKRITNYINKRPISLTDKASAF